MKLVFKYRPELSEQQLNIIDELCFHTTKLYNTANYKLTQNGFVSYVKMNTMFAKNWHTEFLHSHTYQQCLKMVEQNWKGYFNAIKDYKVNPGKYKGTPQPPSYKNLKDRKNEIIFTNYAVRVQDGFLKLSLSKAMQTAFQVKSLNIALSDKVQCLIDFDRLQQVRIVYNRTKKEWYIVILYDRQIQMAPEDFYNVMSIDLGLTNLAACTFLYGNDNYIVSGKPLKSTISYINRRIAHLQSIAMSMTGSQKHKNTKTINRLYEYRYNYSQDYMHKVSRAIIGKAVSHKCHTIVIGDIKDIKQGMDHNKAFVQMPLTTLKNMIQYKAKLIGIGVVFVNEAYTSGCSALDVEPLDKKHYQKTRRINRGLFVSNTGIAINADINGSLNILRRYQKCIPELIISATDKGYVASPVKLRVA